MSADGGNQEEFEIYWARNASPKRFEGGWVERRSHPQVNVQRFWHNENTSETVWQQPDAAELPKQEADDGLQELTGESREWEMSIQELKEAMADGREESLGLRTEELARRAVAEYERFEPRVLSWHDYQYHTFWFFGGMRNRQRAPGNSSFFNQKKGGAGPELFAGDAFFRAAADLIIERIHRMHPINLTYFIWTFSRAGVVLPELMSAVGDHLCKGLLPTLDRCSLGTMVWNFYKQGVRHDELFEAAARELARPNRTRSLAARNFQNVSIAYSRLPYWHEDLFQALARGIPRLLDEHDPRLSKNRTELLFSYTCKDGSEVLADSFRISNLTVILKGFIKMPLKGPSVDRCVASMAEYVRRSEKRSPEMMRTPGDVAEFVTALGWAANMRRIDVAALLEPSYFDLPKLLEATPAGKADQLRRSLGRAGYLPEAA